MGRLGQRSREVGTNGYPLFPQRECVEPSYDPSAANLEQSTVVSIDHVQRPNSHAELDLCSRLGARVVGNHHQLPDGRKLQAIGVHRVRGQSQLHLRVSLRGSGTLSLKGKGAVQPCWAAFWF